MGGIAAGMRVYHRIVEMLVESTSLYASVIVVLLVCEVRNESPGAYIAELAIAMRASASKSFWPFVPCNDYNVFARELCRRFWSTALQQDMRDQTTPGSDSLDMSVGYELDPSPRIKLDLENGLDYSARS
ncbi:hypothetical protein ARMGADRAFT_1082753 [Armillaria gallica]|uniref:Uncharacterized protein n=1 Tax=Armillaria gallica TaxID=47427 RepID=A0A2H3DQG3_ARMGA|nr:hypothetical protein ARMGADRAFT_1082753 [Armillaria gallica]